MTDLEKYVLLPQLSLTMSDGSPADILHSGRSYTTIACLTTQRLAAQKACLGWCAWPVNITVSRHRRLVLIASSLRPAPCTTTSRVT